MIITIRKSRTNLKNNIILFRYKTIEEESGGFVGKASHNCWTFVKKHIVDPKNGEWFLRVKRKGEPSLSEENKLGPWKAPYHNTRGCIELIERLKKLKKLS